MKKALTYIIISFCLSSLVLAQSKGNYSNIQKIKTAYFNKKLDLNEKQAKDFWKIYNQYLKERRSLENDAKTFDSKKEFSKMSDKEIYAYINYSFERKERELTLQKKYIEQYQKVLPAQKVVKILRIEEQFRKYLFKQLKEKKH